MKDLTLARIRLVTILVISTAATSAVAVWQSDRQNPHLPCPPAKFEYCDGVGYARCAHGALLHRGFVKPNDEDIHGEKGATL